MHGYNHEDYLPVVMVQHLKRLESSVEPHISQGKISKILLIQYLIIWHF